MAYFILGAMIGAAIGAIAMGLLIAGKLSAAQRAHDKRMNETGGWTE